MTRPARGVASETFDDEQVAMDAFRSFCLQVERASHAALALIILFVSALMIYLCADVVGGGVFLMTIWFAIPAFVLSILAIPVSFLAQDRGLYRPALLLSIVMATMIFSPPGLLGTFCALLYSCIVGRRGFLWIRGGPRAAPSVDGPAR